MIRRVAVAVGIGLTLLAGLPAEGRSVDAAGVWKASQAAKKGVSEAQFELGSYYYYGQGGLPRDYNQATLWYRRAAEQGNVRAQIALGLCYFHGHGVKRNYLKGIQLIIFPNGGLKKDDPQ